MLLSVSTSYVQLVQEPDSRWARDEQGDDSNDALGVGCHDLAR